MKKLQKLLVLVIILLANLSLWAQNANYYRAAANRGDKVAQYNLGVCYAQGYGVMKDYKQAVYWYTKAANQGHVGSQYNLGIYYWQGCGVSQDYNQSAYWFSKAANQGMAEAQTNLGVFYYNGYGVSQDYKQSFYWHYKSANQGTALSQYYLGQLYYDGIGVDKDYNQAVYWFTKAANQGQDDAQYSLGLCYNQGYGVQKDLKQAFYWYTKAANQNNSRGQFELGSCYWFGNGVEKNLTLAKTWFNKVLSNPEATDIYKTTAKAAVEGIEKELSKTGGIPSKQSTSSVSTQPQPSSTTSSSYSSNSSTYNKYSRWPLFYSNPVFGFRFGYAQRAFRSKGSVLDINVENPPYLNVFGEHGVMNGFQAGFFVIPSRKSMLTLYFGMNYEMYFCSVKNAQSYSREYKEINLYAPFDLSFHVPFSRRSALYVRGGLGFDYSCYNDYSSLEKNEYGRNASDKFNISWECGLDLKIQGLILYANFQKGITKRYLYGSGNPMELDKISIGLAFGF